MYIFSTISHPFCHDWQRIQEARKLHPRDIKMIKDDQEGRRNLYKCMNVMKQDTMGDNIIEECKTSLSLFDKKVNQTWTRNLV